MNAFALNDPAVFREPKVREKKLPFTWRLDPELVKYLRDQGKGAQTETVEAAIRLHRDLEKLLKPDLERLKRFALDHGLDFHDNQAEVIAAAVRASLSGDAGKRPKK